MADPFAQMQRQVPVGCGFRPTEEQLVDHYLRRKLMAPDPSLDSTIPEIDVCKHEPWDLLARAASAFPETEPDDSEYYFFSPRNYKYPNSTRSNRATPLGFWKPTGKVREIKKRGTNKVIGIKKTLVFYQGRVPHAIKCNWVIHEYHMAPPEQRIHVLCKLMKKYEKKTKQKTIDSNYKLIDDESMFSDLMDFEHEEQSNFYVVPEEHNLSNMNLMNVQISFQSNEVMIDSSVQNSPSEPNEATDSTMIQALPQSKEDTIEQELRAIMNMPLDSDFDFDFDFDFEELHCS